jgi:thymidylate synthase (FAD)
LTHHEAVDRASIRALNNLQALLKEGVGNDLAKFALPECYKTELTWPLNARSLQNFLHLRSDKSALWEIRKLAYTLFDHLPEDHRYLFEDFLYRSDDA